MLLFFTVFSLSYKTKWTQEHRVTLKGKDFKNPLWNIFILSRNLNKQNTKKVNKEDKGIGNSISKVHKNAVRPKVKKYRIKVPVKPEMA